VEKIRRIFGGRGKIYDEICKFFGNFDRFQIKDCMYQELKHELTQKLQPLYQQFEPEDMDRLSLFNVQVGSGWQKGKGLLFVGKATNGWGKSTLSVLFSEYDENEDVLSWIEKHKGNSDYNTNKSAFWRVIEQISRQVFNNEIAWYKNIAWSNLCKLAPENEGNPTNTDFYKQKEICKEILFTEIDILQPKVVVLLTSDWDILGINNFEKIAEEKWSGYSSNLYKNKNVHYIHTVYPQGKPEKIHIEAICNLINKLGN
jgi:hypothetical protein